MSKLAFALRALPLVGTLVALPVQAQPTPPPPAPTERPLLAAPTVDRQIAASISAGATLNGGNTKSYGATVGGRFSLIRQPHQFTLDALGTYTAARAADDDEVHATAGNIVGRARYDIFLTRDDALFVALAPRHDRFAGLDLRLQMQGGYLRNLYMPSTNHRVWGEIGYDGTYDNFTPWLPHGTPPDTVVPTGSEFIHSGRLFAGYTNLLTPLCTLNLGVELLYDFEDPDNIRVNTQAELTSSLNARFKLSLLSRILYDRVAVEGKEKTDYVTTAAIVFTYDSITPPPSCPACDCDDKVAAAKAECAKSTVSPADLGGTPGAYVPPEEPSAAPVAPAPAQPAPASPAPAKP